MIRSIAVVLCAALMAGCSGSTHPLPGIPGSGSGSSNVPAFAAAPDRGDVKTFVRIRIPHLSRHARALHPSTISSLTKSVSIAVNAAAAQIFNATPSSPGCSIGSKGTTCTFAVRAPSGVDTFTVTTYSGVNGTGTALDRGIALKVPIAKGKANAVSVTLGPVVTNIANSGVGSLRYAVGSANYGDTIAFLLPAGSTITLTSPIKILGNVKIAGPGANKLSISGGGAHQLFVVVGTAAISGLTLTHGRAAVAGQPGGAVEIAGTLTLAGDTIGNSTSVVSIRRAPHASRTLRLRGMRPRRLHPHCTNTYSEGGAVYNNGVLAIVGTTFTNNVVQSDLAGCVIAQGGAIFNDTSGTFSSTGDIYSGNSALDGGAVYNASENATTFTGDTFTGNTGCTAASGCPTSGCNATICTSNAQGYGAAIYDNGIGISVANTTFTNNVAGGKTAGAVGEGGAIFLNSQLPTIAGSTFSGNLAGGGSSSCSQGAGGAIVAVNALELDGDIFKNNSAVGDNNSEGGAVAAESTINGTGDTFTDNAVVGSGGACTTSGTAIGGAVFSSNSSVTFSKSTFTGNTLVANDIAGGAGIGGADSTYIAACTFASNTALANGEFGATGVTAAGGAFYSQSVAKITASTFTSNSVTIEGPDPSEAAGGAVFVTSGAMLSSGNTYSSNVATEKAGTQTAAGGAVAMVGGTLVSNGDKFTSNSVVSTGTAEAGGVLANTAVISNATISANKATAPQAVAGGLALAAAGASSLTHVAVSENAATGTTVGVGGGLADSAGAKISDSTFTQNTASTAGGGIYSVTSTPEVLISSSVTGNTVPKASVSTAGGAGIFEDGGLEASDITVANNTVTVSGPGPAGGGGILNNGGLLLVGSTLSGNKVLGISSGGDGGGGILSGDSIIADNVTISNNSSSMDGGGVDQVSSSTVTFANSTLYNNTATGKGGNVDNLQQMSLTNSIVGGGHAGSGNDVYNAPAATLTSSGYNIFGSAFAGGGTYTAGTGDKFANPLLLALSNNGGPTFTNADQLSSPGRAYIPYSGGDCNGVSLSTDQRGFTRGAGGKCDAGAYEYAGVATAIRHRALPRRAFPHHASRIRLHLPQLRALRPM